MSHTLIKSTPTFAPTTSLVQRVQHFFAIRRALLDGSARARRSHAARHRPRCRAGRVGGARQVLAATAAAPGTAPPLPAVAQAGGDAVDGEVDALDDALVGVAGAVALQAARSARG